MFSLAVTGTWARLAGNRWWSLLLVGLSGSGVLFSAWLTYLEIMVIHAVCLYCVVSAGLVCLMCASAGMGLVGHGRPPVARGGSGGLTRRRVV